jgi:hypothetical protein
MHRGRARAADKRGCRFHWQVLVSRRNLYELMTDQRLGSTAIVLHILLNPMFYGTRSD